MRACRIILILIAFSACNTVTHQQRKAETFYSQHPERLAKQCADKFPVKDSIGKSDTVYQKADNTDYTKAIDSLQSALDSAIQYATVVQVHDTDSSDYLSEVARVNSLKNQLAGLKSKYKPCKPDTIYVKQNNYIENNALIAYLTYSRDSASKALIQSVTQKDDARKTAKNRLWWIIGLAVVLSASVFLKIKKII